jgi:NTE family protein
MPAPEARPEVNVAALTERLIASHMLPALPYPGLRPFLESEWPIFCGREQIVDELLDKLSAGGSLAVLGTSGSGKSSLIRAGLFATLRRRHALLGSRWRILAMRPGRSPMWSLAQALLPQHDLSQAEALPAQDVVPIARNLSTPSIGLVGLLRQLPTTENVSTLLFVDQFEEVFRYETNEMGQEPRAFGGAREIALFLDQLMNAADAGIQRFFIVITMRTDFIGDCERFPRFAKWLGRSAYLLRRMTAGELAEAVAQPARVYGAEVAPALVGTLTAEAIDAQDSLPLLQHALMRMWQIARQRTEGSGQKLVIDTQDHSAAGGSSGALDQHLQQIFNNELTDEQKALAQRLFTSLVNLSSLGRDTRRPMPLAELASQAGVAAGELTSVIDKFRQHGRDFLLPAAGIALDQATVVDISHESLIRQWRQLSLWLDEKRRFERVRQRLEEDAAEWEKESRPTDRLLPPARLKDAEALLRDYPLSGGATAFVETSRRQAQARFRAAPEVAPEAAVESGAGLCLSGSGFRSMLFHVGTLWRLYEASLLQQLKRISSVSGGSLASGMLALAWPRLSFDPARLSADFVPLVVEPLRVLAQDTIDSYAVVRSLLLPGNVADRIVSNYREHPFGNATLQSLPDKPRFIINATNVQSGALWRFSKPFMGDHRVGRIPHPTVELATAVAASGASPPILSPVILQLDAGAFAPAGDEDLHDDAYKSRVVLTDGSVADNLALETVWRRYDTVFVSDGGGALKPEPKPGEDWMTHLARVVGMADVLGRNMRKRQIVHSFRDGTLKGAYWGLRTNIREYGDSAAPALPCPLERTADLAALPARLQRLEPDLQERLINWGYAVTDAALRHHYDPGLPRPASFPYPATGV